MGKENSAVGLQAAFGKDENALHIQAVLLDLLGSLLAERSLTTVLEKIMQKTTEVMDADRSTLFLIDEHRQEIWSKVIQGEGMIEIRLPLGLGIAGHVAKTGETINVPEAYNEPRFNREIDGKTGYRTKTILCTPMRNRDGRALGVVQVLNKKNGVFTAADERLLSAFATQASIAVHNAFLIEELEKRMRTSEILLNVMRSVSSELDINPLLQKIVYHTSEVMNAERATLFLIDRKTGELWSKVAQGTDFKEIRVPMTAGIAGHVATTGQTVNIKDAYADPRFNPEVDRRTGYHTRTILCMPLRNENRDIVGVMQVLNKKSGVFTREDEELMEALGSQTAITLENSRLFAEVRFMKEYNEAILRTMATGVITLDPEGAVAFCNDAGRKMFARPEAGIPYQEFFGAATNPDVVAGIEKALRGEPFTAYDLQFRRHDGDTLSLNLHTLPLRDERETPLGVVFIADDITQEQRLMGTLCRYVTRQVAEQILNDKDRLKLGGQRSMVAVLFSDIRNFTTISEQSGAEEIVGFLNDYFGRMIGPIFEWEGTLDKFIGDAIMAVFGAPLAHTDDALRSVEAALQMRRRLKAFNIERAALGLPPIENGIGITKGEVISGNIGSEQRMDYTVIGDAVNVASRLEGLTKSYPCKILVNEDVYLDIKDRIECVDLGMAQVKGKGEALRIYGIPDPVE